MKQDDYAFMKDFRYDKEGSAMTTAARSSSEKGLYKFIHVFYAELGNDA